MRALAASKRPVGSQSIRSPRAVSLTALFHA
jgi:hypothetical protein